MLLAVTFNFYLLDFNFSVNKFYLYNENLFMFQTKFEYLKLINKFENLDIFFSFSVAYILPFQITGITDGDGSFGISIIKNKTKTN
jgi:hypothetical protein